MSSKQQLSCALSLVALLAGSSARAGSEKETSGIPKAPLRLTDVDASNGIDVNEARTIAWAYFELQYGLSGGPGDVTRKKRTWKFKVLLGATGRTLRETIDVDAKTGGVWSQGGPRYRDFESFRDSPTVNRRWREGIPPEVVDLVERHGGCHHWGGEEAYSVERGKEINDAVKGLRCDRLEADERKLRKRYAHDPHVLRVIDGASAYEGDSEITL